MLILHTWVLGFDYAYDYGGYLVVILATYVSIVVLVMKPYGITRWFGLNLGQLVGGMLEKYWGKFLFAGRMEGLELQPWFRHFYHDSKLDFAQNTLYYFNLQVCAEIWPKSCTLSGLNFTFLTKTMAGICSSWLNERERSLLSLHMIFYGKIFLLRPRHLNILEPSINEGFESKMIGFKGWKTSLFQPINQMDLGSFQIHLVGSFELQLVNENEKSLTLPFA